MLGRLESTQVPLRPSRDHDAKRHMFLGKTIKRRSAAKWFWGCSSFPSLFSYEMFRCSSELTTTPKRRLISPTTSGIFLKPRSWESQQAHHNAAHQMAWETGSAPKLPKIIRMSPGWPSRMTWRWEIEWRMTVTGGPKLLLLLAHGPFYYST